MVLYMTSKKYIPKYHGGEMIGSFNVDELRKKYNSLSSKQLKRFPTFESYKAEVEKRDSNRLKANKIGDETSRVALEQAELNNQAYNEYIQQNPDEEEFRYKGKTMKRKDINKQKQADFEDWEQKNHPVRANFFRPVVQGLTDVADHFVDALPEPMSQLYQNFAPPTSKFYENNLLKGSGYNIKELRQHAKTLNIANHDKLKKHELIHELNGRGFWDWIPIVKDKIKKFIEKIPSPIKKGISTVINFSKNIDSFNKKSKKTLEQYGNQDIKDIKVFREEIKGTLGKVNSVVLATDGKFYHLGMIITLQDGKEIKVEKNHVVNIEEGSRLKSHHEMIDVDLQGKKITLNEFLDKAIETMGAHQIFEYSATEGRNCQNFVVDVLKSNGLLTKAVEEFTLQDLTDAKKSSLLGEDTSGIIKGLTDTRNAIDNTFGFGLAKKRKPRKNNK
jgi:hypothetical protein